MADVYLVDASVYVFRAWFSLPDEFSDADGHPTNAVYGFTRLLCQLIEDVSPSHIALAFDESLTTSFRNEIYPDYKANRDPAPEELRRQFVWCRQVANSMGVANFADPRYEADDLIGTFAHQMRDEGFRLWIVSGDKDLAQLVGPDDRYWDFARNKPLLHDQVTEKFGVRPDQIADFLALTGDAVDNIPGVPGVGPKSAVALLQHFDDLDTLWTRLDEVAHLRIRGAKSLHQKLQNHRQDVDCYRRLTGIHTRVPDLPDADAVRRRPVQDQDLNALFDQLNFGRLLRRRCLALPAV